MPGGGTFIPTSSNPTGPGDEQATKPLPLWQILLLTASLGGIQFAWTVEFAYGTPYLQSLGMPKPLLALVWLAGPLSGLCIQPLVGVYSDRCTMSWGRRRPFLIGGAFIMVLSVIMVAYSKEFGLFSSKTEADSSSMTIFYAVLGFYLLDFSINTVTTSARALIVDAVPLHQQDTAFVWASRMAGIGNVFGYFTGTVDLKTIFAGLAAAYPTLFGTQLKILCFVSNSFLVICLALSCFSVKEKRLLRDPGQRKVAWYAPLLDIFKALRKLPAPLQSICNVQFFAWLGWFPFLFYVSAWVGERVPDSVPPRPEYDAGARERAGAFALLLKACLALLSSAVLPLFTIRANSEARRPSKFENLLRKARTLPGVWSIALFLFSSLCLLTITSTTLGSAIVIVAFCGISWGVVQWVPFSLVAEYVAFYSETPDAHNDTPVVEGTGPGYERLPDEEEVVSSDPTTHEASRRQPRSSTANHLSAGIVLGIHNIYIVIPQFVSTLITSLIFTAVESIAPDTGGTPGFSAKSNSDAYGWCLRIGAIASMISAWMAWRVREVRKQ